MAARKKKRNRKRGRGGRIALAILAALVALLGAAMGVAALNANTVRVRRAEVFLPDLPAPFDGVTMLYAADIDLCGVNDARKSAALFERLQSLAPDMLVLGGDYTSPSLFDALNDPDGAASDADRLRARSDFFHYICGFSAPLGKYAVVSAEDPEPETLRGQLAELGIQPLFNDRARVERGGAALWIVGVAPEARLTEAASAFSRGDCVLVAAHSPETFPQILTSEAGDSGPWADLVLAGSTHGGQIRLFGRSALPLSRAQQACLGGWRTENGLPVLVTTGVGCEGANLRLGSQAEVWLLTLRSGYLPPRA